MRGNTRAVPGFSHIETFGDEVLADGFPVIEAFIAETTLSA
jgi:hypothetical protein